MSQELLNSQSSDHEGEQKVHPHVISLKEQEELPESNGWQVLSSKVAADRKPALPVQEKTKGNLELYKVGSWDSSRGFGFVPHQGKRAFIHVSVIEPRQQKGSDLNGSQVYIDPDNEIVDVEKGKKVVRAREKDAYDKAQIIKGKEFQDKIDTIQMMTDHWDKLKAILSDPKKINESCRNYFTGYSLGNTLIYDDHKLSVYPVTINASVVDIDPLKGISVNKQYNFPIAAGPVSEYTQQGEITVQTVEQGWEEASAWWSDEESTSEKVKIVYRVNNHNVKEPSPYLWYEPTIAPPEAKGDEIIQRVSVKTSQGVITKDRVLYHATRGEQNKVWGEYDIAQIKQEFLKKKYTELGFYDNPPTVFSEIGWYVTQFHSHSHRDPDEGMVSDTTPATHRGVLRVQVDSRFLGKYGYVFSSNEAPGIVYMFESLDPNEIKRSISEGVLEAVKKSNLGPEAEKYGEQLLNHIYDSLPEIAEANDLVLVNRERESDNHAQPDPRFSRWATAILPTHKEGSDYHSTYSTPATLISLEDAANFGITGEVVEGPIPVIWHEFDIPVESKENTFHVDSDEIYFMEGRRQAKVKRVHVPKTPGDNGTEEYGYEVTYDVHGEETVWTVITSKTEIKRINPLISRTITKHTEMIREDKVIVHSVTGESAEGEGLEIRYEKQKNGEIVLHLYNKEFLEQENRIHEKQVRKQDAVDAILRRRDWAKDPKYASAVFTGLWYQDPDDYYPSGQLIFSQSERFPEFMELMMLQKDGKIVPAPVFNGSSNYRYLGERNLEDWKSEYERSRRKNVVADPYANTGMKVQDVLRVERKKHPVSGFVDDARRFYHDKKVEFLTSLGISDSQKVIDAAFDQMERDFLLADRQIVWTDDEMKKQLSKYISSKALASRAGVEWKKPEGGTN